MDKLEIVRLFLENELQLTPQALELVYQNQGKINDIISYAKEKGLWIIDGKFLEEFVKKENREVLSHVEIVYPEEIREFSIEDVKKVLKERFEFLSKILLENNTLSSVTSLSKVKKLKKGEEATVIGMVRDKTTYSITLEDFTSHETIQMDAKLVEKLFYDDVIAIRVKREEEKLIGDKIFFPSLSFFRKPATLAEEVIISLPEIKVGNCSIQMLEKEIVRVYIDGFKIFLLDSTIVKMYKQKEEREIDALISLIERRHLNPSLFISKKLYKRDLFLIDEVPDAIIVTNANEPFYKPYKSINIFFLPTGRKLLLKGKKIE